MTFVALSWRMLRRDLRSGDLRILTLALIVAVTSVTAVGFFTDRIHQALRQQANVLLGADLVVSSSNRPSPSLQSTAHEIGLETASAIEFPSMVITGDNSRLASINAVSSGYPLRGKLQIAPQLFAASKDAQAIPGHGMVWLESRLMNQLGLKVGDALLLGVKEFQVDAVLTAEPARSSGSVFSIAPRLMLNLDDLAETRLIQPASRARYRSLFSGQDEQVALFRQVLEKQLEPGQRVEGIEDARPEIRSALERAERFLGLSALVSVMLAGVAVATATRRYIRRHLDSCAIMRCLGAVQQNILRIYTYQLLWLGLIAGMAGCLLGYLVQFGLIHMLGAVTSMSLPPASLLPGVAGLFVALITLFTVALPGLLQLRHVPALRVLRREMGALSLGGISSYAAGVLGLAGLILWQAGDFRLGMYVIMAVLIVLMLLGAITAALLAVLGKNTVFSGHTWRFGIRNITRRTGSSIVQVLAFALGIMVLLLLTVVRDDLLAEWGRSLPPDTPNRFLINIQPHQVQQIQDFIEKADLPAPEIFPMVRGRLVAVNGQTVSPDSYEDDRASRLVAREFNLSWAKKLQSDNTISRGHWWSDEEYGQQILSLEQGLAETLAIKSGDRLTFRVADAEFQARVSNLRKVDWDSFRVNFFVLAPPGVLDEFPATYITSFYLAAKDQGILNALVREFPNVTVIDVAAIMDQVRLVIEHITLAIEYVFLFTLLAGVLVMYAAINATLDERVRENAILRMLGANRRALIFSLVAEFSVLGVLSGLAAAAAANLLAYILAEQVFHLGYSVNGWLWLSGVAGGVIGVSVTGYLGTRHILQRPPIQSLRNTA